MKALDARVRGPMRTYGLLVNPWTIAVVRAAACLAWPFRKLWCLLVGHSPEVYGGSQVEVCKICGQER